MAHQSVESDKGFGAGVLLSALAFAGALGMYALNDQQATAWAFAAAMTAAALAVVAIHVYD